ncbi:hypothetical protein [Teredinibacter haidensis]|uniref:hypothetical protein n=1 Tax=Teredinibacter haidensis TaxID=2731755 RepID=UPI000AB6F053|nr:hypothetical protein [Teredinibacter haidensis]
MMELGSTILTQQRLAKPHYIVQWKARVMTPDRQLCETYIKAVAKGGFVINFPYALSLGSDANIELYVEYRGKMERIRAKTRVVYCRLLSNNQGAVIELRITFTSKEEMHIFNNVLQIFTNANES